MEVKGYEDEREQQLERNLSGVGVVWIFSVMILIPAFLWIFMVFPASFIKMATGTFIYDNIYLKWVVNTLGSILVLLYFVRAFRLNGVDIKAIKGKGEIPIKKLLFYGILFVVVEISIFVVEDYFGLTAPYDYYDLDDKPFKYVLLFSFSTTFLTPIYEEFIVRGLFFNKLTEKIGLKKSMIIIGLLFALLHGLIKGGVFVISGSAFYYAYIYHETKSLYAPIFFHFVGNFIAFTGDAVNYLYFPDLNLENPSKSNMLTALVVLLICSPIILKLFRTMWRDLDGKGKSVYMYNMRELHGGEEPRSVKTVSN